MVADRWVEWLEDEHVFGAHAAVQVDGQVLIVEFLGMARLQGNAQEVAYLLRELPMRAAAKDADIG